MSVSITKLMTKMIPDLRSSYVAESPAPVNKNRLYVIKYMRKWKWVQLKSEFQHTGLWSPAARPPRLWCYRQALFFCHLHLTALLFPQGKMRGERLANAIISVRKIANISSVMSLRPSVCLRVRPSVCTEQLGYQWSDFSVKFCIWVIFENLSKFKFC